MRLNIMRLYMIDNISHNLMNLFLPDRSQKMFMIENALLILYKKMILKMD